MIVLLGKVWATAGDATTYTAQQGTNSIKATVKTERCVDDGEVEFDHLAHVHPVHVIGGKHGDQVGLVMPS